MDIVIDSHVHFWDRSRFDYRWLDDESAALRRSFLPADLFGDARAAGVVAVQADCRDAQALAEARWFHELADLGAPIRAVVAQAPLERGRASTDHLAALAELRLTAGVRRLLQGESAGFALQPQFVEGVQLLAEHGLSMDLCIRADQLREATELVARCPETRFVLDHLGKPAITADAFYGWAADLARLAALPNVRCKLSGLASEAPESRRTATALAPWLTHAVEVFGPDRCMFGSDWPVVTAVSSYDAWVDIVMSALDDLSSDEVAAVLGGTAADTYDPSYRIAETA